jgi:hypothetical protein
MKPAWAALGIVLLMSSVFIVVGANMGYKKNVLDWDVPARADGLPNKWSVSDSWNVSGVLNQSDFFKLEIYAAQDWTGRVEPAGVYAVPFKASFVNITDPFGAQTEFECDFLMLSTNPNYGLVFYNISGTGHNMTIEAQGIGTVKFEIPYGNTRPGIVAQALSSGTYTANMWWLEGGGSPPFNMTLLRGIAVTNKVEYTNLYPVGFGVFAVSAVLLVYGFRKPKRAVPRIRVDKR